MRSYYNYTYTVASPRCFHLRCMQSELQCLYLNMQYETVPKIGLDTATCLLERTEMSPAPFLSCAFQVLLSNRQGK
jgi:hypothetical protein